MLSFFILQLLFILLFSFTILNSEGLLKLLNSSCPTSGSYTTGSTFQSNLEQLLSSLPEKTVQNDWFFNDTVGESPDQAYGLAMCYYDRANSDTCKPCLIQAAGNITRLCPNKTTAVLWYPECFIRYSNENFFSVAVSALKFSVITSYPGTGYPEDHDNFMQKVAELKDLLIEDVALSPKLLAVREVNYTAFRKVYGLVQCTRDLPAYECQKCLKLEATWIPGENGCHNSTGCNMFTYNCYMRYESSISQFYNPIPSPPPPPQLPPSPLMLQPPPSPVPVMPVLPPPPVHQPSKDKTKKVAVAVVAGAIALLLLIAVMLLVCVRRKRRPNVISADSLEADFRQGTGLIRFDFNTLGEPNGQELTKLVMFDFNTLREATNNFSDENKLGDGGFGQVFKATLQNGQELAVKRLATTSLQGIVELKNEVELLGRLKHTNLVQLFGYCIQEKEKLLCYEYLPNGSLDKILFATDMTRRKVLEWKMRFNIIEGICRSLIYLHVESGATIIHRDLKASNILLDQSMNPKISDFGLARFIGDETHRSTANIAGTFGYIAPEYLMYLTFSPKSDVFSFGVLILEIVTGRRCRTNLISFVWHHWTKGEVLELKDPALSDASLDQIAKCIHIGLLCMQEKTAHRPSISDVNCMLHDHPSNLPPLPPANLIWSISEEDNSYSTSTEHNMDHNCKSSDEPTL